MRLPTMLLSVHIPKTGGVSFRTMLAQIFGAGFVLHYWDITDAWGRIQTDAPPDTTCIHGHFVAHTLAERYPDAPLITWVRDPVERVASSYYHRLRSPDWRHPVSIELHAKKLTLVQYAGLELVRNETTRFFGKMRPENFAFIGLVEDFDASIDRFFAQFKLPRLPVPRENTNPERRTRFYELRDDERRQILDLNQNDWDLYQACVKANRSKQCLAEQGVYTA